MKGSTVFFMILAVVLYLGSSSAFAQRGHGRGGGKGGGFPAIRHGFPTMHGKEGRHPGRGMSQPGRRPPKMSAGKGTFKRAGRKTAGDLLTRNTKLSSKLQTLLPGVKVEDAAKGFEHLGQFVAAVHASHNLNIPFEQLKAKMADSSPESLGKAIHELRPGVNSKEEVIKANEQALEEMEKARP